MSGRPSSGSSSNSSKKSRNRGKRWDLLAIPNTAGMDADALSTATLPTGYTLTFYPHSMKNMYTAPSEFVYSTKGVLDYLAEYNLHGPNKTKTKLYSCTMYLNTGACSNGYQCREVHFVQKGDGDIGMPSSIKVNEVHQRDAPLDTYPTLPEGHHIPLSLPNMNVSSEKIPTETIFMTKGVKEYFDEMMSGQPTMNMQHCAHFAKNGMCCFGPDCRFVHVSNYKIENNDSLSDSGSSRSSRSTSSSSRGGGHSHKRNSFGSGDTPLSMEDGGRKGRHGYRQNSSPGSSHGSLGGFVQANNAPPTYVVQSSGQHQPPMYGTQPGQPQQQPFAQMMPPQQGMIQQQQPGQQPVYVIVQPGQQPQQVAPPGQQQFLPQGHPGQGPPQQQFVPQQQPPLLQHPNGQPQMQFAPNPQQAQPHPQQPMNLPMFGQQNPQQQQQPQAPIYNRPNDHAPMQVTAGQQPPPQQQPMWGNPQQ